VWNGGNGCHGRCTILNYFNSRYSFKQLTDFLLNFLDFAMITF
jgi:hypothetical protein